MLLLFVVMLIEFLFFLLKLGQERLNHHTTTTAMAAMAASAAATGQNAFFGQYSGLFDPSRTSHLADWHLHSSSFHNAQGNYHLFLTTKMTKISISETCTNLQRLYSIV